MLYTHKLNRDQESKIMIYYYIYKLVHFDIFYNYHILHLIIVHSILKIIAYTITVELVPCS